ncbi:5356_t:CDS:2, partial [Scutellospora calospora]
MHILIAVIISSALAFHGLRNKSLSTSGALCSFFAGIGTLSNDWLVFTVYKAERKKQLEEDYHDGGQRTAMQVACSAFTGTIICLIHQYYYGGQLKCFLNDRTNGGVSPLGLFASILGGFVIGISAVIYIYFADGCNRLYIEVIPVASIAGLIGSIIDSILGATVQISMYSEKSHKITNSMTEKTKLVSGFNLLDNNQ